MNWPWSRCKCADEIDQVNIRLDLIRGTLLGINNKLDNIYKRENEIMATLAEIQEKIAKQTADIAEQKTVEESIVTLLNQTVATEKDIKAQLEAAIASNDPAALQAVADTLDANTTALEANTADIAAAVTANTPAAPAE